MVLLSKLSIKLTFIGEKSESVSTARSPVRNETTVNSKHMNKWRRQNNEHKTRTKSNAKL